MSQNHQSQIERIAYEDDPRRCQATIPSRGQCNLVAVEGGTNCICHGGWRDMQSQKASRIKRYKIARYQARVNSLTDSSSIKSLRDEIAIVRLLIQNHLDFTTNDDSHLLMFSSVIRRLIHTVESLAISCAIIENKLLAFMDTNNAIEMAHDLVASVRKHNPDHTVTAEIRDEITESIAAIVESRLETTGLGNYALKLWAKEVTEFATSARVISLRNEIGILRLEVEERINRCETPHDLICAAMPLCDVIKSIESLVKSCHKLEDATGLLLDEAKANIFADSMITIIGNHIRDSEILQRIVDDSTITDAKPDTDGPTTPSS